MTDKHLISQDSFKKHLTLTDSCLSWTYTLPMIISDSKPSLSTPGSLTFKNLPDHFYGSTASTLWAWATHNTTHQRRLKTSIQISPIPKSQSSMGPNIPAMRIGHQKCKSHGSYFTPTRLLRRCKNTDQVGNVLLKAKPRSCFSTHGSTNRWQFGRADVAGFLSFYFNSKIPCKGHLLQPRREATQPLKAP